VSKIDEFKKKYMSSKKEEEEEKTSSSPIEEFKKKYNMTIVDEADVLGSYDPTKPTSKVGQVISSNFDRMGTSEGIDGYKKYLEDEEAKKNAPKYDLNKDGTDSWWEKALGYLGGGGGVVDTTLPTAGVTQTVNDLRADESYKRPNDKWSVKERSEFGKLYLDNPNSAFSYAERINAAINKREEEKQVDETQRNATESFGSGVANTVGAIATAPLGLADYLQDLAYASAGRDIAPDGNVSPFEYSQAVTGGISEHLNEKGGTLPDDWAIIGGKGWGDVYGLGTSIAQSMASAYTLGGAGTLVSYFGQGAAAGVDDALSRGATDEQALLYGTALGVAEGLAEKVGVDNLFKLGSSSTVKGLIKNILKQAGAEGGEELITSIASNIADNAIMQDKSNFNALVSQYMTQGLSEDEAKKKAWLDSWGDVAFDTIAGAVSGSVSGSVHTGVKTALTNANAKKNYSDQVEDLLVEAGATEGTGKAVDKYINKYGKKGELSGRDINNLLEITDNQKVRSAIESRLTELGETGDIGKISDVLTKQANGIELSASDKRVLSASSKGYLVATEMDRDNIEGGNLANKWAKDIGTRRLNADVYNKSLSDYVAEAMEEVDKASSELKEMDSVTVNTSAKGNATEAKFEASKDAKITIEKDGEVVEIKPQKIASFENGEMSLELEDGEVVNASEVDFGEGGIGLVYQAAQDMSSRVGGFNVDTANVFVRGYNAESGLTAGEYVHGFSDAYRFGKMGVPVSELASGVHTSKLSEEVRNTAYNFGRAFGNEEIAKDSAKIVSTETINAGKDFKKATKKGKGRVIFDGRVTGKSLTERQKASLKGLGVVAEGMGLDIHIFESELVDGVRQGANGWYDPSDNSIHIDLHAGVKGDALMLFTASHELTHHIREATPGKFKVFADALLEEYVKNGQSVEELVQKKLEVLEANGRLKGKTEAEAYDLAYEEVVADACESMLVDSNAIEALSKKLHEKDKGLWERIRDFIAKLVNRIRAAYKGVDPDSREGKLVREMQTSAERLQKLWVDALLEASEVSTEQTLGESGIIVNSETNSASLMSVRDVLSDADRKKVSKALAERFGVTQAEANEWLKAETSLASLILNPKYSQYLDYTADANEEAIKSNSDYPQGTVDFSNICKKRRDFTEVMNRVLRNFPNHVFAATDLAKIRTIMEEVGMEVACAICYVEDRRQLDGPVAQDFIDSLAIYREGGKIRPDGKPFNANQLKAFKLIEGDTYTPSIYELISLKGRNSLKAKNPKMEEAWVKFNNARGMQSVRLLLNDAEYKRQILKYSPSVVKRKNDLGGLRIYSFSDMEMFHLIDIIQVITDSATVGLSLQGYTKVNEYARAVKDTGEKLNRSLIPKGDLGYHMENGRVVLDFDTVEGIDINHPDFFDNIDNPNIGNIVIGINATQIKAAMTSKFIDQIIPFHTGQSGEVLGEKGIATWDNYKDFQSERDAKTKKKSAHQINIYTEVINAAEAEGHPITNKVEFVNKFLEVCKENNLIPRFSDFLDVNENGEYIYTEGYHKFLVDFKTFDQNTGEYLPQMPVKPIFDNEYITKLLTDYVKSQKVKDAEVAKSMPKVLDRITKEIVKSSDNVKYSDRDSLGNDLTKEQQEFFKDSKVRDSEGRLIPVYHGTPNGGFTEFELPHYLSRLTSAQGAGYYFTDERNARQYMRGLNGKSVTKKKLYEVYLNITNPLEITEYSTGAISDEAFRRIMARGNYEWGMSHTDVENTLRFATLDSDRLAEMVRVFNGEEILSVMKEELGYDGVRFTDKYGDIWVAWDKSQIKNTTNKNPTSNSDIRYSDRDSLGNELSAKQKEFFKDSKARDEDGNLYVLYHGTSTENRITQFLTTEAWRTGLWLSTDHATAVHFARATEYVENDPSDDTKLFTKENSSEGTGRQGVYELYANVKNPLIVDAQGKRYWEIPRPSVMGDGGPVSGEEINAFALENDYDGVIINDVVEGNNRLGTDVIVFSPNQVKYTDNLNPTEGNDIRYSDRGKPSYAPTFYSHMGKVVDDVKLEKMGTSSILNHLKNRGVKDEEIKWSGIEVFLEGKKSVTKAELQEFVAGSQLQIEETISGINNEAYTELDSLWREYFDNQLEDTFDPEDFDSLKVKAELAVLEDMEYDMPSKEIQERMAKLADSIGKPTRWEQYKLDGGTNYRELVFKMPNSTYSNRAMRGHWGQDAEGILVHARIQDFNVDGKKMLFIEELQSDWHNEGHEKGYTTKEYEDVVAVYDKLAEDFANKRKAFNHYVRSSDFRSDPDEVSKKKFDWLRRKMEEAEKRMQSAGRDIDALKAKGMGDVADAPFKNNYHEYVLKRLLRMAVEEGYDSIGWTIADTQSKRWSYDYEKAYQIEYDQEMPKFLRKYGKKWGATVGKSSVGGTEIWSMDITDSMKESVLYEGQVFYSDRVTDKKTLDFLEDQKHVTVYRAMQVIDGELYPPMAARVKSDDGKKSLVTPSKIGAWEQAVERPDLIRNGNKFELDKANGSSIQAAYNPYFHTSASPLNDQFSSAYKRPNLVIVEGEIPESELTSGYRAEFAKDTVGETKWHSGPVASKLKGDKARRVFLSRWFKPVRIVPDSEVASIVAKTLKGENIDIPYNVVTPSLRTELERVGVPIKYQDRNTDSYSNRSLLANALESAAQNDIEREKLRQYKQKIDLINAEEQKLHDLREQIKELSFKKGPRDTQAIKSLQFEANQAANRINTYDKQLLNLESTKALKGVLEREKALARKRDAQKYKESLERYREKASKTQRELMERYQESRKRGVESRNKTAMRHKIKDVVNDLNNYLLKGTKDKHVPIELQKAVAEALDAVNMDTVGAEERIAKKRAEMMSAKTPEVVERLAKEIEHIQEMGGNMEAKISRLKTAYDSIINSEDPLVANSHDEVISNTIERVMEVVGETPLRDMSLYQLEAVYDMYRMVLHSVTTANKAFKAKKSEEISVIANRVMEEVDKLGKKKVLHSKTGEAWSKFDWNNEKPVYAFERIGSETFTEVFNNVRSGEDTWATDMSEAQEFRKEQYEKHKYDSWDFEKRYEFTSSTGKKFELSLDQIMSLYAYSKRGDQAKDHLKNGGFVFDGLTEVKEKTKLGITKTYQLKDATAYNLSDETLADIISKLTPEQKAFADAMQEYLSTVMGEKGNEVSLELYGVKLFKEKNYFPLKSAPQYLERAREQAQGDVKIKNKGFTKETVPKAKNPIVLTSFMDVWAGHVNEMSMYHSFTLALEDFYRVFNYKTPASETMDSEGVIPFIENAHGNAAVSYIDQLLKDLNGGARSDPRETVGKALMSRFKKSAVMGSLSVVVQQPTSIIRAMALVDAKYFGIAPITRGVVRAFDRKRHKALWDEVKKYAPVAIIKEMGNFDTGMGQSSVEWLKGEKSFMDKVDDVLSKAPAVADELAWISIWNAVKKETAHNNPTLKTSSEEFLRLSGERFTEVITKTQVYDSTLAKSSNMRSKSALMNMWTSFMAEPTTTINMVADAFRKGNKKYIARVLGATVGSIALNAALVSLVYAMRDDDEDETFAEKYLSRVTTEFVDGINPVTYIPFVKDMWSILQGFDVERADMALITDLFDSIQGVVKVIGKDTSDMDEDELSKYQGEVAEALWGIVDSASSLGGIPEKNIRRDINGIINLFKTLGRDMDTTYGSLMDKIGEDLKDSIPVWGWIPDEKKGDKLYDAIIKGDKAYEERLKNGYKSDSAYDSAIRKALRENDPRIKEAAEAKVNGDSAEANRIAEEIAREGHFSRENIKAAIKSEVNNLMPDDTSDETSTEDKDEAISFYDPSDINAAFENGETAHAKEIIADLIKTKVANGKTEKEAKSSLRSSMTSYWKPLYKNASESERIRIRKILYNSGLYGNADEVIKSVNAWLKD